VSATLRLHGRCREQQRCKAAPPATALWLKQQRTAPASE
jgi:hypothetical protein